MRGNAPGTAYEVGNEKLLKNLRERGINPQIF